MPFALQVAMLIRYYGQDTYRNAQYPTSDGIIPYKMFWCLSKTIKAVMAMERLSAARASAHGQAMVEDGKNPAVKRLLNSELDEAFGIEE